MRMRSPLALSSSLVVLFLLVLMGCSSSPEPTEDPTIRGDAARDLVQTRDALLAVRVDPQGLDAAAPLLARLAPRLGAPLLAEVADDDQDAIAGLARRLEIPNQLSALDQERSSFLVVSHQGNDHFLRLTSLGLPTTQAEWPAYVNLRLLLPTASPETLTTELGPWLQHFLDDDTVAAYELYPSDNFVRVELAIPWRGFEVDNPPEAQSWLQGLHLDQLQPPLDADFRPTPAYDAFLDGDAAVAIWAPISSLSTFATGEIFDRFARQHERVGPAGKPRFFLEGVGRIAAGSVVDDPMTAENEDFSVLLAAHGARGGVVDLYTTRTAQGAKLYEASQHSVELPVMETDASFLELGFQIDLEAIERHSIPPYWTTLRTRTGGSASLMDVRGIASSVLPFTEDDSSMAMAVVALQYPSTSLFLNSHHLGSFVPLPRAMVLHGVVVPEGELMPVGAAIAGAFADTPEVRNSLEQIFMLADARLPGALDGEMVDREDEWLELRAVVGSELTLSDAFGDSPASAVVAPASLSLAMGALDMLEDFVGAPTGEATDVFDHIHLRTLGSSDYHAYRLTLGAAEASTPAPLSSRLPSPRSAPQLRCRTEIAGLAVEHLSDLRRDPQGAINLWASALEEKAGQCSSPPDRMGELIQERIELAKEIAAEIP